LVSKLVSKKEDNENIFSLVKTKVRNINSLWKNVEKRDRLTFQKKKRFYLDNKIDFPKKTTQ